MHIHIWADEDLTHYRKMHLFSPFKRCTSCKYSLLYTVEGRGLSRHFKIFQLHRVEYVKIVQRTHWKRAGQ